MNARKQLATIKACVADWKKGKLSDGAAMQVVAMTLYKQPKPTKTIIEYAKQLAASDTIRALRRRGYTIHD